MYRNLQDEIPLTIFEQHVRDQNQSDLLSAIRAIYFATSIANLEIKAKAKCELSKGFTFDPRKDFEGPQTRPYLFGLIAKSSSRMTKGIFIPDF